MATIWPRIRTRDFAYLSTVPFSLTDSTTSHPFSFPFAARSPQKVGSDPVVYGSGTKRGKLSAEPIFRIVKTKIAKIVQENDGDLNGFSVLPAKRRLLLVSMILFVLDTLIHVATGKPRTWTSTYEHRRVPSWSRSPLFILSFPSFRLKMYHSSAIGVVFASMGEIFRGLFRAKQGSLKWECKRCMHDARI
jgi:hypothetical protein